MSFDPNIVLSEDQQKAFEDFVGFMLDPHQYVFVLSGYSGTGKSTLVHYLIEKLGQIFKTAKLIDPNARDWDVQLTATTNQAADALAYLSGMDVRTIHSFLGLRVETNYRTQETTLIPRDRNDIKEGYLLFVDEASKCDTLLLGMIFQLTNKCKIVLMGDKAQLLQVKSATAPAFEAGFPGAHLSKVMRQAEGSPIMAMATSFRNTVETGVWEQFVPDGHHVQWLSREHFEDQIRAEFTRPDWSCRDSKVLAWTNKTVIAYNQAIRDLVHGDPELKVDDFAVCNKYMKSGAFSIPTDKIVLISDIGPDIEQHGVIGNMIEVEHRASFFMPKRLEDRKALLKYAQDHEQFDLVAHIETFWIDLRAAFACTIDKSQGSTYDTVFIDLDDLRRCTNGNTLARLMYVGTSRARHFVKFTGDLA
jgi:hypothetical protein